MIVGLGWPLSSSGALSLPGELDPLFRSEVCKTPIRNRRGGPRGRIEHLARLGSVVCTWVQTRLGSIGHRVRAVGIKTGATWHFGADAHARFVGPMRAPGRPGEPQSTGDEQRRYCQGQMFCFHCFLLLDSSFNSFLCGIVRGFLGVGFRFGTKAGISGAKRQRAGMNLIPS